MDSQYNFINKLLDKNYRSYEFLNSKEDSAIEKLDKLMRSNEITINYINTVINQGYFISDFFFIYLDEKHISSILICCLIFLLIDIVICIIIKFYSSLSTNQIFLLKILKFCLIGIFQIWVNFHVLIRNSEKMDEKCLIQVIKCSNILTLLCLFWTIFCFNYNLMMSIFTLVVFNAAVCINIITFLFKRNTDYFAELISMNIIIILGLWYKSRENNTINKLIPAEKKKAIVSYFQELINSLNTFIISLTKDNLLFLNDYAKNIILSKRGVENKNKKDSLYNLNSLIKENDEKIIIEKSEVNDFLKNLKIKNYFVNRIELIEIEKFMNLYDFIKNEFNRINTFNLTGVENKYYSEYNKLNNFGLVSDGHCFLDVNTRINKINNEYVLDLVMFDISEIIKSEKLKAEQKYKKIMFSKIAHEFKTPLIDSITICSNILENTNNDIIQQNIQNLLNLSYYSIFLTENLILYCNSAKLDEKQDINLYELIISCTNIIESVVLCNGNPNKNSIKLEMECEINNCVITENLFGLKQILLNIFWLQQKSSKAEEISIQLSFNEENKIIEFMTKININQEKIKENFEQISERLDLNIDLDDNDIANYGLSIISNLSKQMQIKINTTKINNCSSNIKFCLLFTKRIKTNLFIPNKNTGNDSYPETIMTKRLNLKEEINKEIQYQSIGKRSSPEDIYPIIISTEDNIFHLERSDSEYKLDQIENFFISNTINFNNNVFKIILVEDNKSIRDSNHRLLQKCLIDLRSEKEYELIICTDGIEILYYLFKDRYSNLIKLILSDENMDFMNGSEAFNVYSILANKSKLKKCPFISVTNLVDESVVNNIIKSGSDYILNKPLTKQDLINCLKKFILK